MKKINNLTELCKFFSEEANSEEDEDEDTRAMGWVDDKGRP